MNRIRVLVEGPTEQTFVREVLAPEFLKNEVDFYPMLFSTGGGICKYPKARKDIIHSFKGDSDLYCTTMVDFYGLPPDWPDREQASSVRDFQEKAKIIEDALMADITGEMGESFNSERFIPYVQMHEFEAILFADPDGLAQSLDMSGLSSTFQGICDEFTCPEKINDNYDTSPARRIIAVYPSYQKVIDGVRAAKQIGLQAIRVKCPHFDQWLSRLEQIGS